MGPRGMDKLIVDSKGSATISNDGATILNLLDIVHPAAKTLVDIAKSQDVEVKNNFEKPFKQHLLLKTYFFILNFYKLFLCYF